MKHASTGTNYAMVNKQVKAQHEKKPASNLIKKYADCRFLANIYETY